MSEIIMFIAAICLAYIFMCIFINFIRLVVAFISGIRDSKVITRWHKHMKKCFGKYETDLLTVWDEWSEISKANKINFIDKIMLKTTLDKTIQVFDDCIIKFKTLDLKAVNRMIRESADINDVTKKIFYKEIVDMCTGLFTLQFALENYKENPERLVFMGTREKALEKCKQLFLGVAEETEEVTEEQKDTTLE